MPPGSSLPTWERGLKSSSRSDTADIVFVAPYMGAWIEIVNAKRSKGPRIVAPYMGAWIEIHSNRPVRNAAIVAPYMGAWIEILNRDP